MPPSIPQLISVRPVILITGFLGAGKTTLLRNLLISCQDQKLHADVILNDFSDANYDTATIEGLAKKIEPLSAGCACCESFDFLLDLSLKSSESNSDILFIELNGAADPVPIVESYTMLEEKLRLHPRWQICVIDTRYLGKRKQYADIEKLQLQTASHIYLSHLDAPSKRPDIIKKVREVNAFAQILTLEQLSKDLTKLAQLRKPRIIYTTDQKQTMNLNAIKKSEQHLQTHTIHSCEVRLPEHATEQQVKAWLQSLPANIIRAKALIRVKGKPEHRYLFERVGVEICPYSQRVKLGKSGKHSAILIGPDLDMIELKKSVERYFN